MTLPYERTRAVIYTRNFLVDLMHRKGIPKDVREQARSLLKHYPMNIDMRLVGDNPVFAILDDDAYND
jgi:hypothetical protein